MERNIDRHAGRAKGKHRWLRITGKVILILLAIIVSLFIFLSLWLTPRRLTHLVEKYASEELNADISASAISFSLWSSFPYFDLNVDSLAVVSRGLRRLPASVRDSLPDDCDTLCVAGNIRGSINVMKLLASQIRLKNVIASGLRLNLVSVNDSVNNFDVFYPSDPSPVKMPYISADSIVISTPCRVDYLGVATAAVASASINGINVVRRDRSKDIYRLSLSGKADATVGSLRLFDGFPFELDGDVSLSFDPFRMRMSDYRVDLANIRSHIDMSLNAGSDSAIEKLDYSVSPFSILRLLEYLPSELIPFIDAVSTDMTVTASVRMLGRYRFTSTALPSFKMDFKIPDSSLTYSAAPGQAITIPHISADASLLFDGDNVEASRLIIPRINVNGEGLSFRMQATVDSITGPPCVNASLAGYADIAKALSGVRDALPFSLRGMLDTDLSVKFRIPDLQNLALAAVNADGYARIRSLGYAEKGRGAAEADKLSISFGGKSSSLTPSDLHASGLMADMKASGVRLKSKGVAVTVKSLEAMVADKGLEGKLSSDDFSLKPVVADMTLHDLRASLGGDNERFRITRAKARCVYSRGNTPAESSGYANVRIDSAMYRSNDMDIALLDGDLRLKGDPKPVIESLSNDSLPVMLALLDKAGLEGSLSASGGLLSTPHYPQDVRLGSIDLAFDPQNVVLRKMNLDAASASLQLSGVAGGLRPALASSDPGKMNIRMNVALDSLDINRIAHALETHGKLAALQTADGSSLTAADSMPFLIPRWLNVNVKASVGETSYANLRLTDLKADLSLSDGVAAVQGLRINSDFGRLHGNIEYDTSDTDYFRASVKLGLDDVDIVSFFENFRSLLAMMPQMSNLRGNISLGASLDIGIFPKMFIDIPSLRGYADVGGTDLTVHQNPFIKRLARMVLINRKGDIHINNIEAKASFHDNLLEVYPFPIEIDRYKLMMMGMNDFNGNLDYHISVLRSPLPFHFGVNIRGMFHSPELRFGGTGYDPDRNLRTMDIELKDQVNIVSMAKKYIGKFMHTAAVADVTPGYTL